MAKLIKITESKAFKIEAIKIDGKKSISIRQMYTTKKAPDQWMPSKNGVTLPLDDDGAERVAKAIKKLATDPETKFKKIEINKD